MKADPVALSSTPLQFCLPPSRLMAPHRAHANLFFLWTETKPTPILSRRTKLDPQSFHFPRLCSLGLRALAIFQLAFNALYLAAPDTGGWLAFSPLIPPTIVQNFPVSPQRSSVPLRFFTCNPCPTNHVDGAWWGKFSQSFIRMPYNMRPPLGGCITMQGRLDQFLPLIQRCPPKDVNVFSVIREIYRPGRIPVLTPLDYTLM